MGEEDTIKSITPPTLSMKSSCPLPWRFHLFCHFLHLPVHTTCPALTCPLHSASCLPIPLLHSSTQSFLSPFPPRSHILHLFLSSSAFSTSLFPSSHPLLQNPICSPIFSSLSSSCLPIRPRFHICVGVCVCPP